MGKFLTREGILSSAIKTAEVEAFGGVVLVKELDALTMQNLMQKGARTAEGKAVSLDFSEVDFIDIVARHVVDEQGNPVLKRSDVESLAAKGWGSIQAIVSMAMGLSGVAVEQAGVQAGELEKN